ncbi:MAG: ABC transporter permease, partial [Acidobacteriota bacterium]
MFPIKPKLEVAFTGAEPVHVVVLGHGFWQRRFGGDAEILGRTVKLNGLNFSVIGVAPEFFKGSIQIMALDFWAPSMMQAHLEGEGLLERRERKTLNLKGRLKPGVTVQEAEANLQLISEQLASAYPETNQNRKAYVLS